MSGLVQFSEPKEIHPVLRQVAAQAYERAMNQAVVEGCMDIIRKCHLRGVEVTQNEAYDALATAAEERSETIPVIEEYRKQFKRVDDARKHSNALGLDFGIAL